jgi:hypothetical protein
MCDDSIFIVKEACALYGTKEVAKQLSVEQKNVDRFFANKIYSREHFRHNFLFLKILTRNLESPALFYVKLSVIFKNLLIRRRYILELCQKKDTAGVIVILRGS